MTKKTPSHKASAMAWPSAAGKVRRDEQRRPVEQDPRDVAKRGWLPFADLTSHRWVRTELGRVDPDGRAERRQAACDCSHHRDGQRQMAARRALRDVRDPGKPSTAGARKKLPWMLAHRTAIGTTSHNRRGCAARSTTKNRVNANSAIPISCGRSASAGADTANAPRASHAAVRTPSPGDGTARRSWPQ